ncbi:hypothetical protein ACFQ51_31700 [Streptomyces kaempferi]
MKPYGDGTAGDEVSYTVLIRPELDGTALPELPGTLILGEVFALAAEGEARRGAPFWMVAGAATGRCGTRPARSVSGSAPSTATVRRRTG